MQVGKWLDQQGIDVKPSARPSAASTALPAAPSQKATEKLLAAVYAPWNDMDNGKHQPVKVTPHLFLLPGFSQAAVPCTSSPVDDKDSVCAPADEPLKLINIIPVCHAAEQGYR